MAVHKLQFVAPERHSRLLAHGARRRGVLAGTLIIGDARQDDESFGCALTVRSPQGLTVAEVAVRFDPEGNLVAQLMQAGQQDFSTAVTLLTAEQVAHYAAAEED